MRVGVGVRNRSSRSLCGLPLYDIALGPDLKKGEVRGRARGIIAIGDIATGWLALGGLAKGVFAVGGVAVGLFAFGGIALGLVSVAGVAVGVLALGGGALGVIAIGGGAIGIVAVGAGPWGSMPMVARRGASTLPVQCSAARRPLISSSTGFRG